MSDTNPYAAYSGPVTSGRATYVTPHGAVTVQPTRRGPKWIDPGSVLAGGESERANVLPHGVESPAVQQEGTPTPLPWVDQQEQRDNKLRAVKANNARDRGASAVRGAGRAAGMSDRDANAAAMNAGHSASGAVLDPQATTPIQPQQQTPQVKSQYNARDWVAMYGAMSRRSGEPVAHEDIIKMIGAPPTGATGNGLPVGVASPNQVNTWPAGTQEANAATHGAIPIQSAPTPLSADEKKQGYSGRTAGGEAYKGKSAILVNEATARQMYQAIRGQSAGVLGEQIGQQFTAKLTQEYGIDPKTASVYAEKFKGEPPPQQQQAAQPTSVRLHTPPVASGTFPPYLKIPGFPVHMGGGRYGFRDGRIMIVDANMNQIGLVNGKAPRYAQPVDYPIETSTNMPGGAILPDGSRNSTSTPLSTSAGQQQATTQPAATQPSTQPTTYAPLAQPQIAAGNPPPRSSSAGNFTGEFGSITGSSGEPGYLTNPISKPALPAPATSITAAPAQTGLPAGKAPTQSNPKQQPPVVKTKEEFEALPAGVSFINGRTGELRVKS